MMKKKLLAFLTALICMASASALPVSADSVWTWDVSNDNGAIKVVTRYGTYHAVLVETDGTELTEDMVSNIEGYSDLYTWEEYNNTKQNAIQWVHTDTNAVAGENSYMVCTDSMSDEELLSFGRKLMISQDCIVSTSLVDFEEYSYGTLPLGYNIRLHSEETILDAEMIPELADFLTSNNGYVLEDKEASTFYAEMIENLEGDTSPYAMYEYMRNYGNMIGEKYSDIISSIEVYLIIPSGAPKVNGNASSIWDTAGDHNADGTVNAQDGADILQLAAELGTGARTAISSASDVNADGTVDAQDAAAVLTFAAASGSGSPLTWVEILR